MAEILIGVLTGEYARHAQFYDALFHLDCDSVRWCLTHHQSPAAGRNQIVSVAQRERCSHILFLDDDMAPPVDTLARLLAPNRDIVTGLYLSRNLPHFPLIFTRIGPGGASGCPLTDETQGVIPVAAAGLGCCLMKTTVFDRLEPPYFRLGELHPETWSDDLGFFYRWSQVGGDVWCDTDCRVGHWSAMRLWPDRTPEGWTVKVQTGVVDAQLRERVPV